jgi:hypothetical protein
VTVEDGKLIHENKGSYFTLPGAMKTHSQLLGLPFEDVETFDDFC